MSFAARKKIIAKLQFLHQNLTRVLPKNRLQKIVAGASIFLSVSLSSLQAQVFLAPVENPFGLTEGEEITAPVLADIDGDGDMDLLASTYNYAAEVFQFEFYENIGSAEVPSFAATPVVNPFGFALDASVEAEGLWTFDLADMDNDGDLDLLIGAQVYSDVTTYYEGRFHYYENTGTVQSPAFAAPQIDPFGIGKTDTWVYLNLVDLDSDGDMDVYGTELYGLGKFFENTGTTSLPAFSTVGSGVSGVLEAVPDEVLLNLVEFGDLDGDGDMDVFGTSFEVVELFDEFKYPFFYQENTGGANAPVFALPDYDNNPMEFDNLSDSLGALMSIADLDNDGDMDVLINAFSYNSTTEYYEHNWLYFENASPVGTEELLNSSNVQFFPNPTSDQISIKSDSDLELTDLRIFDVTGRMVEQRKLNDPAIDVSHLASGVYLLKLYSGDEFVGGNKLIKK